LLRTQTALYGASPRGDRSRPIPQSPFKLLLLPLAWSMRPRVRSTRWRPIRNSAVGLPRGIHQGEATMKAFWTIAGLLVAACLTGCEQTPAQKQADAIRTDTQQKADAERAAANRSAEAARNQAGKTVTGEAKTETAEKRADEIEKAGEQKADVTEKEGERKADAVEAGKPVTPQP
jgi:hypothetical protein